jgi:hypothetical protein
MGRRSLGLRGRVSLRRLLSGLYLLSSLQHARRDSWWVEWKSEYHVAPCQQEVKTVQASRGRYRKDIPPNVAAAAADANTAPSPAHTAANAALAADAAAAETAVHTADAAATVAD